MWALGIFVLLSFVALPARWRVLSSSARLRRAHPNLSPDPDQLGEHEAHEVFAAAREALGYPGGENAGRVAGTMESLLSSFRRAPGVLATLALLALYGVGWLSGFFGLIGYAAQTGAEQQTVVSRPAWRIVFPAKPLVRPEDVPPVAGDSTWRAILFGTDRYGLVVRESPVGSNWVDGEVTRIARESRLSVSGRRDAVVAGLPGTECEFSASRRVLRARFVEAAGLRYIVTASAPKWGEDQRRFLDSFTILNSSSPATPQP
jgi:hypothetical protein